MSDKPVYIFSHNKPWGEESYNKYNKKFPGEWVYVSDSVELFEAIKLNPSIIFFSHWSDIVPKELTEKYQCVCFHMTDLPYGRGGSPLQNLIMSGHNITKLTALKMDEGVDTGPIYWKFDLPLYGTALDIFKRATDLSWDGIEFILNNSLDPEPQKECNVAFKRRKPEESELPHNLFGRALYDFIRMLDAPGYPHAFIKLRNGKVYFTEAILNGREVTAKAEFRGDNE